MGDKIARSSPVQVGSATDWASVSHGRYHTMAIKTTGTLWGWGRNSNGILGLGNTTNLSSPVQVGTDTDWAEVSATYQNSFAVKTTGTLWSWGSGSLGMLGLGNTTSRSSPVQVGTDTDWSKVRSSSRFCAAIKTTGAIWAWGRNIEGEALFIIQPDILIPTQIGTDSDWADCLAISDSTLAIKTTGTLWAWGNNGAGELGLGDKIARSSPVQVGSGADWSVLGDHSVGGRSISVIKTNGTLWTWGVNTNGELGLGNTVSRSSPVQVGTDTDWSMSGGGFGTGGNQHMMFLKTGGGLWGSGSNLLGRVTSYAPSLSSPVQIGTDNDWTTIVGSRTSLRTSVKGAAAGGLRNASS